MKVQIRKGLFETNSSSAHTLTVFDKDEWEEFKQGERVIEGHPYNPKLIKTTEADKIFDPDICDDYINYSTDYFLYKDWINYYCRDRDVLEEDVADKHIVSIYQEDY